MLVLFCVHSKTSLFFFFILSSMLNPVKCGKIHQHLPLEHTHTDTHIFVYTALLFPLFPYFLIHFLSDFHWKKKKKCHVNCTGH